MDILWAEVIGKAAKDQFINERFKNGSESSFFDPIKKHKLLMMEACRMPHSSTNSCLKPPFHMHVLDQKC